MSGTAVDREGSLAREAQAASSVERVCVPCAPASALHIAVGARRRKAGKGQLTVQGKRLDVLGVVGEGHELVAEADRVLALGHAVELLEVGVGDGLRMKGRGKGDALGQAPGVSATSSGARAKVGDGRTRRGKYICSGGRASGRQSDGTSSRAFPRGSSSQPPARAASGLKKSELGSERSGCDAELTSIPRIPTLEGRSDMVGEEGGGTEGRRGGGRVVVRDRQERQAAGEGREKGAADARPHAAARRDKRTSADRALDPLCAAPTIIKAPGARPIFKHACAHGLTTRGVLSQRQVDRDGRKRGGSWIGLGRRRLEALDDAADLNADLIPLCARVRQPGDGAPGANGQVWRRRGRLDVSEAIDGGRHGREPDSPEPWATTLRMTTLKSAAPSSER